MDAINLIKEKLNIVDFISNYVELKHIGKNHKGLCPFHSEKSPSFIVSSDIQRYKCFGCSKSGDIVTFAMEKEGLTFPEALRYLGAGIDPKLLNLKSFGSSKNLDSFYEINRLAAEAYHQMLLKHPSSKPIQQYFAKRGIKPETITEFKLGYAPEGWDNLSKFLTQRGFQNKELADAGVIKLSKDGKKYFDFFRGRVTIPIQDLSGKFIAIGARALKPDQVPKYINTKESEVYHKEKNLYGLYQAKKYLQEKDFAIVVEGYFDMISPYQNGYKNIVATCGTALTTSHLNLIKRFTKNVVLVFDGDQAGVNAAIRSLDLIQLSGINAKIAVLPKDVKDPDELMKKNPQTFQECLDHALPIWDFCFLYVSNNYNFDDVFSRKQASDFLLGVISKISDEIMKNQYVKKFATLFDVPEQNVLTQLGKNPPSKILHLEQTQSISNPQQFIDKRALINPESYILNLLFNSENTLLTKFLNNIKTEYFLNPIFKDLFSSFVDYVKESTDTTGFSIKAFYDKLQDSSQKVPLALEAVLMHENPLDFDKNDLIEAEFYKTLKRLKVHYLQFKIKENSQKIRRTEAVSNSEEQTKLQQETKVLVEELNKLQTD
jgi:DNA primase